MNNEVSDSDIAATLGAVAKWRDSLVNLSARNKLLNYRATKASTVEFTEMAAERVYETIASRTPTVTMGTRPPEPKPSGSGELEQVVLDQLEPFDPAEHPHCLFADRTQRDVDRALRNLKTAAHREYVDKGLHTLYVGFGELRWLDKAGDVRRSPLILVPARLTSPGPRERLTLSFSDDDPVVNPSLGLLLLKDFGLQLPSSEDVIAELDGSGLGAALALFDSVAWPSDWELRDFAVLSTFVFAKEAMYRDLLDNADVIASSPLVQALAGVVSPVHSPFVFDATTYAYEEDGPESASPLILDADSSQHAAVLAAVAGRSFTLDGPPGTGKSQTIANIIAAVIKAGKTVLFVSEKAVALDVVRRRLGDAGLGSFVFELHSSKTSRKQVADHLGFVLDYEPDVPPGLESTALKQLTASRRALTSYVNAVNRPRMPLNRSFHDVLGLLEQTMYEGGTPPLDADVRSLTEDNLADVEVLAARLQTAWPTFLEGANAPWYALTFTGDKRYALERLSAAAAEAVKVLVRTKALRHSLGFAGDAGVDAVAKLITSWSEGGDHREPSWLTNPHVDVAKPLAARYFAAAQPLEALRGKLKATFGEGWDALPAVRAEDIPPIPSGPLNVRNVSSWATHSQAVQARDGLEAAGASLARVVGSARELATRTGVSQPRSTADASNLCTAVSLMTAEGHPHPRLVTDVTLRSKGANLLVRAVEAMENLQRAEAGARPYFTAAALTTDLSGALDLRSRSRGLFKAFSPERAQYRTLLDSVSDVPRKVADANLSLAVDWRDAHLELAALEKEASMLLPGPRAEAGAAAWDELRSHLDIAERVTALVPITNPTEFNRVFETLPDPMLQRIHASAASALTEWKTGADEWLVDPIALVDMDELSALLNEYLESLSALIAFTEPQSQLLGEEATLEAHAAGGIQRANYHEHLEAARQARHRLDDLFGLPKQSEPSITEAERVQASAAWAETILKFAHSSEVVGSPNHLTDEQLSLLTPVVEMGPLDETLARFRGLADDVAQWFDGRRRPALQLELRDPRRAVVIGSNLLTRIEDADDSLTLDRVLRDLDQLGLRTAADVARTDGVPQKRVRDFCLATVYRAWLDAQLSDDDALSETLAEDQDEIVARFRALDSALPTEATANVIEAAVARRPRQTMGQTALIHRESTKKRRHIPVRELISQARDAVRALQPCFMMSPLAVSQYLPPEMKFDVVIFDEASQVTPADAINCVYRGEALITAGDQKQLPPTSFFDVAVDESDDDEEQDVATDFESILDLMKSTGAFGGLGLRWHYRSRHERLISFSNDAFYDGRLVSFPSAVMGTADAGVHFHKVDGVYRRASARDNPLEAQAVANRVLHHFDTRPHMSLGVVAFSTAQRDAIEDAIDVARESRPDLDTYFDDDRMDGFFVKSLESVQGDERDAIIFSVGYGPDEHGSLHRQFGPVSRAGGERRLNVAVTRARELVEVFTSMTAADIGEVKSSGAQHLRKYLEYAQRANTPRPRELSNTVMPISPLESAVADYVRSLGYHVLQRVGEAEYRIDIAVGHPDRNGSFILGIECDGQMYAAARSTRDRERLRAEVLEKLGWNLYRVWSTNWFRQPTRSKERLKQALKTAAQNDSPSPAPQRTRSSAPVTREPTMLPARRNKVSEWQQPYVRAKVDQIPAYYDLSDSAFAGTLVKFVQAVAEVEAPLHIDVLAQRLREASAYERIGSRIRSTLIAAVKRAKVKFNGTFIRTLAPDDVRIARSNTEDVSRTIEHVAPEEIRVAINGVTADAGGIQRDALISAVANAFGWARVGAEIRDRLSRAIDEALREGDLNESAAGLRRET